MDSQAIENAYPVARPIARLKALSAERRGQIAPDELQDIESELLADFCESVRHYDPNRASLRTFASRVMDRKLVSILRHRSADRRLAHLLADPLPDGEYSRSLEIGTPMYSARALPKESCLDIERAVRSMPAPLAELAQALCWMSPSEAGRLLGYSRSTVYNRIGEIRTAFLRAGVGPDHLASSGGAA